MGFYEIVNCYIKYECMAKKSINNDKNCIKIHNSLEVTDRSE